MHQHGIRGFLGRHKKGRITGVEALRNLGIVDKHLLPTRTEKLLSPTKLSMTSQGLGEQLTEVLCLLQMPLKFSLVIRNGRIGALKKKGTVALVLSLLTPLKITEQTVLTFTVMASTSLTAFGLVHHHAQFEARGTFRTRKLNRNAVLKDTISLGGELAKTIAVTGNWELRVSHGGMVDKEGMKN